VIEAAGLFRVHPEKPFALRDRINSGDLIAGPAGFIFTYLEQCPCGGEPLGIVLATQGELGRAVFEAPVLLPEEQFVPLDLIRGGRGRPRSSRPSRSPARDGG
jgi:hypothetical protein